MSVKSAVRWPRRPRLVGIASGRRILPSTATALGAVVVALLAGGSVYLLLPSDSGSAGPDTRPPAEQIDSANNSVASAKMMIQLMSGAVGGATDAVTTITSGAEQLFDAVDTATVAANEMVAGLQEVPDVSTAATQASAGIAAVSGVLSKAQSLSVSVGQLDSMVTPVIEFLESTPTPSSAAALRQLRTIRDSSREISQQLSSLDDLESELATVRGALTQSARGVDNAVSQAEVSAEQLHTGLSTLGSARADTVAAATSVTDAVGQLQGVLTAVTNDLDNAQGSLSANQVEQVDSTPNRAAASADNVATRVSWAVISASVLALVLLVAVSVVGGRRARRSRTDRPDDTSDSAGEHSHHEDDDLVSARQ